MIKVKGISRLKKYVKTQGIGTVSVQDKNLKSWEGKGLIGVSRKPKKPS